VIKEVEDFTSSQSSWERSNNPSNSVSHQSGLSRTLEKKVIIQLINIIA